MKSPENNWQAWVEKAENDLLNVRNNVAADEVPGTPCVSTRSRQRRRC